MIGKKILTKLSPKVFAKKTISSQRRKAKHDVRQANLSSQKPNSYEFRRSRTLVGSLSNDVAPTQTHKHSHVLKSSRTKQHERTALRKKTIRWIISGGVVVVAVLAVLAQDISGSSIRLSTKQLPAAIKQYQATIDTYFSHHPLQQFSFSYHDAEAEKFLMAEHPEVRSLTLQNHQFYITIRQPILVWKSGNDQTYVDQDGVAFKTNYFAEPTLSVTDNSGIKLEGNVVTSSRFIRFFGQLVGAVNARQVGEVSSIILPSGVTRELDIKLVGKDYTIKTNINRDPLQQAEDIARTIAYLEEKGITPSYIDARVSGKAFYQ